MKRRHIEINCQNCWSLFFYCSEELHIKNEYSSNINRIIFHFKQYFSDPNMNKDLKYRTTEKPDRFNKACL